MRTPLLALFAGSLLIGCTVGDTPGGDDDGVGGFCGDGVVQSGEECDGTAGCTSTCTLETPTPLVDVALDKTSISTELMTTHMITVTVGASGGFSGPVNLTATVVDGANAPLPTWTVAFDNATINLTENGNGTAIATLTIPSENKALDATIRIDATSSLGTKQVVSTVTVANQLTFPITLNGGQCVYPAAATVPVSIGTKVRWLNKATNNITIHVSGNTNGIAHQPDPGSAPNAAYEQTVTGNPGAAFTWYCHAPGPTVNNLRLQAVAL